MTGWLTHPSTGYLIEPGTNNLVIPGSLASTPFRWDAATGLVEEVPADDVSPTAAPEPEAAAAPIQSRTPTPVPTPPTDTVPAESATPAAEPTEFDTASARSIGTHPVTRILVIILLVALGAAYYSKLRSGGRASK